MTRSQTSFPVSIVTTSVALKTDGYRLHNFYLLVFVATTGALLTHCYRIYNFNFLFFVTKNRALLTHCYWVYHFYLLVFVATTGQSSVTGFVILKLSSFFFP